MSSQSEPAVESGKSHILRLPTEILLYRILLQVYPIAYYWKVAPLAIVCRHFNTLITPYLYSHITIQTTGKSQRDDSADHDVGEEWGRKAALMRILTQNQSLAEKVRTWDEWIYENIELEKELAVNPEEVARSLTRLVKINAYERLWMPPTGVVAYIIENITAYKNLRQMKVHCRARFFESWGKHGTRLSGLEQLHLGTRGNRVSLKGLINVILTACPDIRFLAINGDNGEYNPRYGEGIYWEADDPEDDDHNIIPDSEPVAAPSLQHFGLHRLQNLIRPGEGGLTEIQRFVQKLIQQTPHLKSVTFAMNELFMNSESSLELPQLQSMNIKPPEDILDMRTSGQVVQYLIEKQSTLQELRCGIYLSFVEDFLENRPFERLPLDNLRMLKLWVTVNPDRVRDWRFTDETNLKMDELCPFLYQFLLLLPRSLETLRFRINATDWYLSDDKDFRQILDWCVPLFLEFRRLSRLTIQLYTSNPDGGVSCYPENELVAIRRPRLNGKKGKCVIRWWLHNTYQHSMHRYVFERNTRLLTSETKPVHVREHEDEHEGKGPIEDDDDGRDVKHGEEEFEGPDGEDWWYGIMEYERIRFLCEMDNCESEERKWHPNTYPGP